MADAAHAPGRGQEASAEADYYGLPALKASHWKWMVAIYILLAGLAGAVQILAALVLTLVADPLQVSAVLRPARYGAFLACIAGTVLLIVDLKTPRRFLNMLRIYRRTSPMSYGSWVLVAFSALTAVTALLQLLHDLGPGVPRWLDLWAQWPAALLGLVMVTYTAPLLSATSTPLWARSPALLAGSFAAFSMAGGAAVMTLWGLAAGGSVFDAALERFAFLATLVAWAFLAAWFARAASARLTAPLLQGGVAWLFVLGVIVAGLALPVLLHLVQFVGAERLAWVSALAAAAELVGSLLWRGVLLLGGQHSAQRAADALRFAAGP